jgi:hypothetical protein
VYGRHDRFLSLPAFLPAATCRDLPRLSAVLASV